MAAKDFTIVNGHRDKRGLLYSVAGQSSLVPFSINRVFWVTDFPPQAERGGHYHEHCVQAIICLTGHITVTLDGPARNEQRKVELLYAGALVHVPPLTCVAYKNTGSLPAVVMVLCSHRYNPEDSIPCSHK